MTGYTTTRPTKSLLIPKKRPLKTPSTTLSKNYSTEKYIPTLHFISSSSSSSSSTEQNPKPKSTNDGKKAATTTTEFNFSLPPQPFLDPGCWEKIRSVSSSSPSSSRLGGESGSGSGSGGVMQLNEREKEEERRRRRAREAEYGGMAVRGRLK
ncbi:hypothetical protein BO83DRAFT_199814 [Aspergillus eucalypticola CBS 122712]|uniref:Uncharacterized protein n=1 Tax=Aspergillus eucalypticola (strain CBS 122712 / IBT 29274) TaxID=1448314 RepID=A0A317W4M5_ASPEC|nr:uncharacterized protein BO83DRAFT_199814 [Aspergillus eucalypticola CBS 122712]PWY79968.1 hypothetical protein BO83DRAFT_199814 [Aspergillus eucalypticola CBS 122712]